MSMRAVHFSVGGRAHAEVAVGHGDEVAITTFGGPYIRLR